MSDPIEATDVNVVDDGDPRHGVTVFQPFVTRVARPGVFIGLVLTGLLGMFSMTILITYLAPSLDRLTEVANNGTRERVALQATIDDLQAELTKIGTDQLEERSVDDCISLYLYDIEIAKGVAQVTLGDNLATAILVDDPDDNRELAQEVYEANTSLREALAALNMYREIDPPPGECPHPEA